ncbi:MAG: PepSY domain-containing protein [Pseudomonadales bacterium]|nr:PepSY domain-containing protein [Pseudomonadales bacterium]
MLLAAPMVMSSLTGFAYEGSQYAGEAKITLEQAEAIAMKSYPGTIVEIELEHKLGGSGLRYSFDIRAHHNTQELAVDAKTGAILKNSRESKNDDD